MYPATIFNWHDLSEISNTTVATEIDDAPLFMTVFSSDKGTEELIEISGNDFANMYGTMSFDKHGQSAIQAQRIIDNGGRLFCKRVVAEDSTIANLVLIANVTKTDGSVTVKWTSQYISGCKSFDEVKAQALELLDADAGVFPLLIYSDNGRGVSKKAIRLNPDYATSKTIGKMFYTLYVYEGSSITEQISISFDPTVVYNNNAYRLDEYVNTQITGVVDDTVYEAYVAYVADAIGTTSDDLRKNDIVYGYTNSGNVLDGFELDQESVDLDADTGIEMKEGTNGTFGDAPVNSDAWTQAIVNVYNGTFSNEVYDVDTHKVACILDANYPEAVKNAIFDLVKFREDCVFLRDYGTDITTFLEIKDKHTTFIDNGRVNRFTADYATSYQVKDPNTKKNINVTMLYDMAAIMPNHIANNAFSPLAGTINGFILPEAIKGTINFTPINTPSVNQKQAMDDIRVNYAIFQENNCVVQSVYSSQEEYTQLSYISNVIAIQMVMRAVRTACPRQRYSLATGTDLTSYAEAVNNVLSEFLANFDVLRFTYTQDALKASQKIFYASIEFAFLNWAQTEIFDIYAINNE